MLLALNMEEGASPGKGVSDAPEEPMVSKLCTPPSSHPVCSLGKALSSVVLIVTCRLETVPSPMLAHWSAFLETNLLGSGSRGSGGLRPGTLKSRGSATEQECRGGRLVPRSQLPECRPWGPAWGAAEGQRRWLLTGSED